MTPIIILHLVLTWFFPLSKLLLFRETTETPGLPKAIYQAFKLTELSAHSADIPGGLDNAPVYTGV